MTARIPPLAVAQWDAETVCALTELNPAAMGGDIPHVWGTLAQHGPLLRRIAPLVDQLTNGLLTARQREILVLRSVRHDRCSYAWEHHVRLAARAGLSQDEIDRIRFGDIDGDPCERALLRAVDDLHEQAVVSEPVWRELEAWFDPPRLLEILVVVGTYRMVAGLVNSCRVQVEEGR